MDVVTLLHAAMSHGRAGRWQDAERVYREVISRFPDQVDAHHQLGRALRATGRREEGVRHQQIAVALRPDIPPLLNGLGLALRELARLQEAAKAFVRAGTLAPSYSEAFYNLGRLQGEATSYHRAEDIKMSVAGRITLCPPAKVTFSFSGEQDVIAGLVARLEGIPRICADIGASDGVTFSNSYPLFRDGWDGAAIEGDPAKLPDLAWALRDAPGHVACLRSFVTPDNVSTILTACGIPQDFGFLSLDIDSYDHFALAALLETHRPWLLCTEISVEVPPPVRFALRYDPAAKGKPKMVGQSISMLEALLRSNGYALVALEYNNAFAVRADLLSYLAPDWHPLTAEEAWCTGYVERPDRTLKFPWLKRFEPLIDAPPETVVSTFQRIITGQEERYVLETA